MEHNHHRTQKWVKVQNYRCQYSKFESNEYQRDLAREKQSVRLWNSSNVEI